jgi:hypothetical protein
MSIVDNIERPKHLSLGYKIICARHRLMIEPKLPTGTEIVTVTLTRHCDNLEEAECVDLRCRVMLPMSTL